MIIIYDLMNVCDPAAPNTAPTLLQVAKLATVAG
jgi:hypothetical protein